MLLATRRCLRCTAAADWMAELGLPQGSIAERVLGYDVAGTHRKQSASTAAARVRGIVAQQPFTRGDRICLVPDAMVLTGDRAALLLRGLCNASASSCPLSSYDTLVQGLLGVGGRPELLASRDGLLLTSLLYVLKNTRGARLPVAGLRGWADSLPARIPQLGVLLHQHFGGRRGHDPLHRRLALGKASVALKPDTDAEDAARDLMVAAVEAGGLEALRNPHTEVVVTQELLTDFYQGRRSALTPRQYEAAAAPTLRNAESLSLGHLRSLEAGLHAEVLLPTLRTLHPPMVAAAEDDLGERLTELSQLQWAHSTLRSRAVNVAWRRGGRAEVAVVPFLDRLNHSTTPNVTYHHQPTGAGGGVVVTAVRSIRAGEELTLDYGHFAQRSVLFGDTVDASNAPHSKSAAVAQEVRRIERRQLYEMTYDDDEALMTSSPTGTNAEVVGEVTWLWRYGFMRSSSERAAEASQRWCKGLRQRIAHLTDVRRKGRMGEFVIGVPEGLAHLREQREALERQRYNNARVFPPQRT